MVRMFHGISGSALTSSLTVEPMRNVHDFSSDLQEVMTHRVETPLSYRGLPYKCSSMNSRGHTRRFRDLRTEEILEDPTLYNRGGWPEAFNSIPPTSGLPA